MLEDEPAKAQQGLRQQAMFAADGRQITWPCAASGGTPRASQQQDQRMVGKLEAMRARLERLLPSDSP